MPAIVNYPHSGRAGAGPKPAGPSPRWLSRAVLDQPSSPLPNYVRGAIFRTTPAASARVTAPRDAP
jgi:hypothetical protein